MTVGISAHASQRSSYVLTNGKTLDAMPGNSNPRTAQRGGFRSERCNHPFSTASLFRLQLFASFRQLMKPIGPRPAASSGSAAGIRTSDTAETEKSPRPLLNS
jgi:hypothetical protein